MINLNERENMYSERKQPWTDKHGKRIWELEHFRMYPCLNMAEVREFLDPKADHTHQVSWYHETDGTISNLNRWKYWKSFYKDQANFLTHERDSLNKGIESCEGYIKIYEDLIKKEEAINPDERTRSL